MKRFYKAASVVPEGDGHAIQLDGRPVRTPAKRPLVVPTAALAEAIAAEWEAQGAEIDPRTLPLTGFANAAIDQIAPDPAHFAASVAAYGESDLLCYRAEGPTPLVQAQVQAWNPVLDWAEKRYGISFSLATGILHVAQPPETVAVLADAVIGLDAFRLAGLSVLVTMSGSLVCGLALLERAFPVDQIWNAAELDEIWQAEQWGQDEQAEQRRTARATEFVEAARLLTLLDA